MIRAPDHTLYNQVPPADNLSLDPDQVISADEKKHRKYLACNESNPLAMDLIGRLNTSEFVNGTCHLLRCHCVGQLKTFDSSSWTRGPNFVSSLYLYPYFVYIRKKG